MPWNRKIDESGKDGTPNSLTLGLIIYEKERIRYVLTAKQTQNTSLLKVAIAINEKATEKNRIVPTWVEKTFYERVDSHDWC